MFVHSFLCEPKFSFFYDKYYGVRMLGQMVSVCLTSYEIQYDTLNIKSKH